MRSSPVRLGSLVVVLVLLASSRAGAVPDREGAKPAPEFGKDLVVFLGCGNVGGPGTLVQLGADGKVLGTVKLPGAPYGLTAHRHGLVAVVPGQGLVLKIDGQGQVDSLIRNNPVLPSPIAVAADPASGDLLVADNRTDVLQLLPAGQPRDARQVLQIKGHERHLQNMSVAFARGGALLYGGSGPTGVYRFHPAKAAALGVPLLPADGAVAADPTSQRWVAALKDELRVFEDDQERFTLPYPAGLSKWHSAVAFGADGTLVLALHRGQTNYDLVRADLGARTLRPLFTWGQARIVSLAVGPKMAWGK